MLSTLTRFVRRLFYYTRRRAFERDLEDEMRFHLAMSIEANRAAGR